MEFNNSNEKKIRRNSSFDMGNMVYGKVPPQAKEIELVVLGAIMVERDAFDVVKELLEPEAFYVEAHQRIFRAMVNLSIKNMPIDLLTVVEELKLSEDLEFVGGPIYISKLTNGVMSSANIETHARIILEKYLMREVIRAGGEMINMAYEDSSDVFDVLDFAENKVSGLRLNNVKKHFKTLQNILKDNLSQLEELRLKDDDITGVPSGFDDLDKVTCGWQPTDLIILAARPSVGKTAFALTLGKNASKHFYQKWLKEGKKPGTKKSVGFFSLEMADKQLVNRVLSSESKVWMWRLQNGKLSDDEMRGLYRSANDLETCSFLIDDTGALKIGEFRAKAKRMVHKHNCGLIIIDYLQLMKDPTKKLREQEISSISSQLKAVAKELEIPIIALSQLSRDFGKQAGTGSRAPQLSDLRESGAIEQDADLVMFLYKPTDADIEDDRSLETIFFADIAKHRNGASPVKFMGDFEKKTQSHAWLRTWDSKNQKPIEKWNPGNVAIPEGNFRPITAAEKQDELPF